MTQPDLFTVQETLSPRLAWMREHEVSTRRRDDLQEDCGQWEAAVGDFDEAVQWTLEEWEHDPDMSPRLGIGMTELAALRQLAWNNEWPLWEGANAQ